MLLFCFSLIMSGEKTGMNKKRPHRFQIIGSYRFRVKKKLLAPRKILLKKIKHLRRQYQSLKAGMLVCEFFHMVKTFVDVYKLVHYIS